MNNLFRGLLAGYGAKKLGGGCFSTILIFVVLWMLLGQCGASMAPDAVGADASAVERTMSRPAGGGHPLGG